MSSSSSTPLSVVVADDEPAMLSLVASHMKRLGFTVHEASDGAAAWKLVQQQLPDLVMLDVMMPEMSGWEVARAIKAKGAAGGALAHTPVLMLTGIGERLNAMNSPLFAADGWLDKPFEFSTLDEKIAEVLEKHGKDMPARPGAGPDKPAKASGKSAAKKAPAKKVAAAKPATKKAATKNVAPVKTPAATKAEAKKPVAKKTAAPAAAPAKNAAPAKSATKSATASKPAKKSASKVAVKEAAKSPAKKSGSARRASR